MGEIPRREGRKSSERLDLGWGTRVPKFRALAGRRGSQEGRKKSLRQEFPNFRKRGDPEKYGPCTQIQYSQTQKFRGLQISDARSRPLGLKLPLWSAPRPHLEDVPKAVASAVMMPHRKR